MLIGLSFGLAARLDLFDGTVMALLGVGWDFRAPVRAGDTVTVHIEIVEVSPSRTKPDRGVLRLALRIVNQTGATVQEGSARLLMSRTRPATAAWGRVEGPAS
jgi:acyl dehydratase